ncbi:tRNA-splicing endonuclease subunit Sen15 [Umbelopsis sp. PMI_123]|nr:tRNA-splicing endonuclease subunit Sen15 [Umbelopsis sp. PMI_123]
MLNDALTKQVYQDLTLGKQWQNVKVVQNVHNGRPVLIAQDPDRPANSRRIIIAVSEDQLWSLKQFDQLFSDLKNLGLSNLMDQTCLTTVTMAIVAQDSTTAYYDIHDGMKKPGELEVNDELLVASD